MSRPTVIYIPNAFADSPANGGVHRRIQILTELQSAFGPGRVVVAEPPVHMGLVGNRPLSLRLRRGLGWRLWGVAAWLGLADSVRRRQTHWAAQYALSMVNPPGSEYRRLVTECRAEGRLVAVLENVALVGFLRVNRELGVPTVACPHNLECFTGDLAVNQPGRFAEIAADFASEVATLTQCDRRLMISRVETGVLRGMGFTAQTYPYQPAGAVRERLLALRARREATPPERGLALLLGTAAWGPTRRGMTDFLLGVAEHGLPTGVRVVMAGAGTDTLLSEIRSRVGPLAGVESLGWAPTERLDQLLATAQVALVPQRSGFGALTRMAELACVGLPTLVHQHVETTMDLPPGVRVLGDPYPAWKAALSVLSDLPSIGEAEYRAWAHRQGQVLIDTVTELADGPANPPASP